METTLPEIRFQAMRPADLILPEHSELLRHINNLVNDAYSHEGHPKSDESTPKETSTGMFPRQRISSHDQLAHELGKQGLIAICTDESLSDEKTEASTEQGKSIATRLEKYGNVVAVASIKSWGGKIALLFAKAKAQSTNEDLSFGDVELAALAKTHLEERQ